ncbi:MAG: DUF3833 domain-containing protein [Betaproteobacteria bacterium]|nr:DUF3833 domain-containing protein [Betaproteobacteria bacterium]NBT74960.1 DUF3833 domain-containing protein [Betaproteobacteria bacterium]NCA15691.1 DUF3833 domain-containing protein [Betaproteobacteria bacterium]NDF03975.1 DUF3833 domain-containing protein [Betaproteobacteria bacterium]
MKSRLAALLGACASCLIVFLQGCASPSVQQYAHEKPLLSLEQYFKGQTQGWGMVTNRQGVVTRRFVVSISGQFEGETGTLDESFVWSDGERQHRIWTLRKNGPGRWIGTADDVVGEAIGEIAGNTLRWRYTMALPVDGRTVHLDFDDWMVLIDDKVLLNRAAFSKFGIHLGEVTLSFQRP